MLQPPTPEPAALLIAQLTDPQVVGLTAFHEAQARLEPGHGWVPNPIEAMHDIVEVVANRWDDPRWLGMSLRGICLQRKQFSCWMETGGAANYGALLRHAALLVDGGGIPDLLLQCVALATVACDGDLRLRELGGATHYYAPESMIPPGAVPAWVPGATLTLERFGHRFYTHVR